MLVAVIADVHGNLAAFESVLGEIRQKGIQKILIAGDLVGYGPRPNEVIALARQVGTANIRGNHEDAVLTREYSWFNDDAAAAAKWTAETLTDPNLSYIGQLPTNQAIRTDGRVVGMFHGSPDDPYEYVLEDSRAEELLQRSRYDIVICGHTHVPMHVRRGPKLFLNPGSVGQPRDGDRDASFSVLDTASLCSETVRVEYDVRSVQREMLAQGLPRSLAARLAEGR